MSATRIILGIDPGLEHTGWGVIQQTGNHLQYVRCGRISTDTQQPIPQRLVHLELALSAIVADVLPTAVAVEEVYVNVNARTSLKLGQARGICLVVPARLGIPVAEYAPAQVKKALVGGGRAAKEQVGYMIQMLLPQARPASPDAADALAVAICHAHSTAHALR